MSLLSTFIPYEYVIVPLLGVFIGTTKFACFPLLQYSMFYLFGIYFCKNGLKMNKSILMISCLLTGISLIFIVVNHRLPNRFPPELFWITLPCAPLAVYWVVLERIKKADIVSKLQRQIGMYGSNMLDYLVLSNLLIFMSRYCFGQNLGFSQSLVMIAAIYVCCIAYTHIKLKIWPNQ